jgi:hypothetical protein
LSHSASLFLSFFFFFIYSYQPVSYDGFSQDRVSQTVCLGLALNCDPSDLCLLSC